MAANIVWGLDIGSSAIKAVKMQRFNTECSIIDFDIIDIPAGDEAERPARLNAAMKNLTETHKFGNDPVFLAIPGAVCLHREFTLPPTAEAKLHEMVQFEARQQIPFPLDQVEWGYERFDATEDANKGINITLIAVRKSDIQEMTSLCANYELKLEGIAAAPMALYNFINFEFKPNTITLILDAGARGTDFVVMNKRQIYFRSIQIAGREITRVLENKFKVPYDKAESLKKNIEKSPQMDQILSVIEPTLRNLGADVQRTIGFYKAKSRGQKIQNCYLLGHAFRLPKMAEYLQSQVREAPFALVEGLQRIRLGSTVEPSVWEHEFPTMAVAIGLGIQGLGLGELNLNLIPRQTEVDQARAQWKKFAAMSAAIVVLTFLITYYFSSKAFDEFTRNSKEADDLKAKLVAAQGDEKTAIKDIPAKREVNLRLQSASRDREKIHFAENTLLTLKGGDDKAIFGLQNKTYVTNFYASRAPLDQKSDSARWDALRTSEGLKRLYDDLKTAGDPYKVAPEMRPDAPLIVILSGQVQVVDNNPGAAIDVCTKIEDAIKKIPQCKGQKVEFEYSANRTVTYVEHIIPYTKDGALDFDPQKQVADETKNWVFMPFHFMFVWEDPADKDIVPPPPAPPAPPGH
ncbi:MAG TPA: pilus assembly protein PilM [Planctomycetota bacterium]|nr:pilus assembly protein PilM [Planctomycetota bacterium]